MFLFICLSLAIHAEELTLELKNVNSDKGEMLIAIHNRAETFLKNEQKPFRQSINKLPIQNNQIIFEVPKGEYSITLFHDLNSNQKLDKNFLGIPTEPFGFSKNPRLFFGPPSYEESLIPIHQNKKVVIELKSIL